MPLKAYTPSTLTERRALSRQLNQIAQRGYAQSDAEYQLGATSIAAPVVVRGTVKAAIGIVNYPHATIFPQPPLRTDYLVATPLHHWYYQISAGVEEGPRRRESPF